MEDVAKPKLSCTQCGFVSTEPGAFFVMRRWPGTAHTSYCRRCWRARFVKKNNRVIVTMGLSLAVGVGVLAFTHRTPETEFLVGLAWLEVNIALMMLLWPLNAGLHELGHALAAKAMGMRVFRVYIGHGRPLLRSEVMGIDLRVNSMLFLGGLTFAGHLTPHLLRTRQAVYVAAGPAANLALAGILALIGGRADLGDDLARLTQGPAVLQVMLLANLLMAASSLFPARINTAMGTNTTDGTKLLGLLQKTPDFVENSLLNRWILESSFALQDEDFTRAGQSAASGLERKPGHPVLLNSLGIAKLGRFEFEGGRETFVEVLKMHEASVQPGNPLQIAESLNNIAYADLFIGGAERLCEADCYSRRACELVPRELGYEETRGCVLVELGRYEEGRRLLSQSTRHVAGAQAVAIHHGYLALANARLGDGAAASAHVQKAKCGQADHPVLIRILAKMDEPDSAPPAGGAPGAEPCLAAEAAQLDIGVEAGPPARSPGAGAVALGFLMAPLASGVVQGIVMLSPAAGIFVLPFAYPLALLLGVPGYLVFRRLGWLRPWQVILAGAGGGAAVGIALLLLEMADDFLNPATLIYMSILIVHGAAVAAVFWWIAIRTRRITRGTPNQAWY